MGQYVILLPGDEQAWLDASDADREATYARHGHFAEQLAQRGHTVVGGAELTHSRETQLVRASADGSFTVTDGPYAETVEHLTGFYIVESADLDDLLEVVALLAVPEHGRTGMGAVEVRAVAQPPQE